MEELIVLGLGFLLLLPIINIVMLANVLRRQNDQESLIRKLIVYLKHKPDSSSSAPGDSVKRPPMPVTAKPDAAPAPTAQAAPKSVLAMPPRMAAPPPMEEKEEPSKASAALQKVWNWIIINEEYRPKNMSWEFAIASTWLLRMAVVLFVIGIGFFLKFSIEKGYLAPVFRVALAGGAGCLMIVGGSRLLNKVYHLLGQGLMGGGVAVLYCTVYAAHHFYGLVSNMSAFAAMGFITVAVGILAIRCNSLLIAVLGIIGGAATPLLFRTDTPNFTLLFSYLLLLNVGVLAISSKRNWPLLVNLAVFCTYAVATLAVFNPGASGGPSAALALGFFSAYFLIFNLSSLFHQLQRTSQTTLLEAGCILVNAFWFFGLGGHVLPGGNKQSAIFCGAIALFFALTAAAMLLLQKRRGNDLLLSIFYSLVVFFSSRAVFLYVDATWATLFLAMLATLYMWLSEKLESYPLWIFSCILWAAPILRLLIIDFGSVYIMSGYEISRHLSFVDYLPVLGRHIGRIGIPVILLQGCARRFYTPERPTFGILTGAISVLFLLAFLSLETFTILKRYMPGTEDGGLSVLWGLYALALLLFGICKTIPGIRHTGLALFGITLAKVFLYDLAGLDIIPKMAAFLILGVLLFLAALLYLKFAPKSADKA